jgi:hypothetical protein
MMLWVDAFGTDTPPLVEPFAETVRPGAADAKLLSLPPSEPPLTAEFERLPYTLISVGPFVPCANTVIAVAGIAGTGVRFELNTRLNVGYFARDVGSIVIVGSAFAWNVPPKALPEADTSIPWTLPVVTWNCVFNPALLGTVPQLPASTDEQALRTPPGESRVALAAAGNGLAGSPLVLVLTEPTISSSTLAFGGPLTTK